MVRLPIRRARHAHTCQNLWIKLPKKFQKLKLPVIYGWNKNSFLEKACEQKRNTKTPPPDRAGPPASWALEAARPPKPPAGAAPPPKPSVGAAPSLSAVVRACMLRPLDLLCHDALHRLCPLLAWSLDWMLPLVFLTMSRTPAASPPQMRERRGRWRRRLRERERRNRMREEETREKRSHVIPSIWTNDCITDLGQIFPFVEGVGSGSCCVPNTRMRLKCGSNPCRST